MSKKANYSPFYEQICLLDFFTANLQSKWTKADDHFTTPRTWFWEHLRYICKLIVNVAHISLLFTSMYIFYLPLMSVKINTKNKNVHSLHKLFIFHNLHRKSESWKKTTNVNLKENRCLYTQHNSGRTKDELSLNNPKMYFFLKLW